MFDLEVLSTSDGAEKEKKTREAERKDNLQTDLTHCDVCCRVKEKRKQRARGRARERERVTVKQVQREDSRIASHTPYQQRTNSQVPC